MKKEKMIRQENKIWQERKDAYRYCECGTARPFPKFKDRLICPNCGKYIYKDKETEFKYKLGDAIRRNA